MVLAISVAMETYSSGLVISVDQKTEGWRRKWSQAIISLKFFLPHMAHFL